MNDFSYCNRCKVENPAGSKQCVTCGRRVVSSKRIRVLGVLLIVIGLFLTIMMAVLTFLVAGVMLHSGEPGGTTNFTGTREQAMVIFGMFGVIFAIGVTSLVGGIYQIKYGKRNLMIQIIAFILVALVVLSYWLFQAVFPHPGIR